MTRNLSAYALAVFLFIAVFGVFNAPKTAYATSGSIPEFSVNNQLQVHIRVTCPGSVGFDWQVAVDNWGQIHQEQTTDHGDFSLDGSKISNGHHNAIARVHCNGESWEENPGSTVGFDWFGGNPTPVPPPPGYEVSISLTADYTVVSQGSPVRFTAQAACSGTTVRAIRLKDNGAEFYQLGVPVITPPPWSSTQIGDHVITAEAACNGDDNWHTSPTATLIVSVKQNAPSSGGGSAGGTAGNPVAPTQVPPTQNSAPSGNGPFVNQPTVRTPGQNGWCYGLRFTGGGFAANSPIHISSKYDENACQGGHKAGSWGPEDRTQTDGQGSFVWDEVHGGTGSYEYVFSDNAGHAVKVVMGTNPDGSIGSYSTGSGQGQVLPPNPKPVVDNNSCPSATNPFKAGDIAIVADTDPSPLDVYSDAGNGQLILQIPIREPLSIVGPEKCLSGYRWVQIGYKGKLGWAILVGPKGMYNLVPNKNVAPQPSGFKCDGKLPARLSVGSHGRTLRASSGLFQRLEADQIRTYPQGTTFAVLEGPGCGTYNVWYKVKVDSDGAIGWFAEGRADVGYWLEPVQAAQPQPVTVTPTATPTPVQQASGGSQQSVATFNSYESCDANLLPPPSSKRGMFDLLSNGFAGARQFTCTSTGELVMAVNAFGGVKGEQPLEASGVAYVTVTYTPSKSGVLIVEADMEVNGKGTVASSTAFAIKDAVDFVEDWQKTVWGVIVDLLTPEQLDTIKSLLGVAQSTGEIQPTTGYLNSRVFMTVISDKSYTVFDSLDGKSETIFPTGPLVSNFSYSGRLVHMRISVPVSAGKTISIRVGQEVIARAKGWSMATWNLKRQSTFVRAIAFTE